MNIPEAGPAPDAGILEPSNLQRGSQRASEATAVGYAGPVGPPGYLRLKGVHWGPPLHIPVLFLLYSWDSLSGALISMTLERRCKSEQVGTSPIMIVVTVVMALGYDTTTHTPTHTPKSRSTLGFLHLHHRSIGIQN